MYNIKEGENLKAIPIMLKGDALDFFDDYHHSVTTYQESI